MFRYTRALVLIPFLALLWLPTAFAQDGLEAARQLAQVGDTTGAIKQLNELISGDSGVETQVQARYMKGMLLLGSGDNLGAKSTFQGLVTDYPTLPEPYNNLAAILASEGEFEGARALLIALLEQYPEHAVALENLGDLYAKMAADAYRRARTLEPSETKLAAKLQVIGQLFGPTG
jgi:Flp pilus assembly protein TadD